MTSPPTWLTPGRKGLPRPRGLSQPGRCPSALLPPLRPGPQPARRPGHSNASRGGQPGTLWEAHSAPRLAEVPGTPGGPRRAKSRPLRTEGLGGSWTQCPRLEFWAQPPPGLAAVPTLCLGSTGKGCGTIAPHPRAVWSQDVWASLRPVLTAQGVQQAWCRLAPHSSLGTAVGPALSPADLTAQAPSTTCQYKARRCPRRQARVPSPMAGLAPRGDAPPAEVFASPQPAAPPQEDPAGQTCQPPPGARSLTPQHGLRGQIRTHSGPGSKKVGPALPSPHPAQPRLRREHRVLFTCTSPAHPTQRIHPHRSLCLLCHSHPKPKPPAENQGECEETVTHQGAPIATTSFPGLVPGDEKGLPHRTTLGGSELPVTRCMQAKLPGPPPPGVTHTLAFSKGPGPGQEAWWSLEGGGLSNPLLLKRANREVKIGNKNKIAAATLVVCVGNKASPGPTGQAQLQPLPDDDECPPTSSTTPPTSHPGPRAGGREECEDQVRIPVVQSADGRPWAGSCAEPPPCAWAPSSATGVQTQLLAPPACHGSAHASLPGAPPAASRPAGSLTRPRWAVAE